MKILLVGLALIGASLGAALPSQIFGNWQGRIVGGANAVQGQIPHQASLRSTGNTHYCGGFIINNQWVISAGHCANGIPASAIIVVVGSHLLSSGGTTYTVSNIVVHPGYNESTISNDISLIRTTSEILFNTLVQPIALSSIATGAGVTVTASGWGQTSNPGSSPDNLQYLDVQTITNQQCYEMHSENNREWVHENTICTLTTAGEGMCGGDSGGPLTAGSTVVGVVSWGISCALGYPDVFARISSHFSWINSVI